MKSTSGTILITVAFFILITTFLLFFIGPELIQARYFKIEDYEKKGQMGDAFGGTLGPIIAWAAAILTFLAFYIQYEANKVQRRQFEQQAEDTMIERFENRFFEMIRIHRANVDEQNIQNKITGRKVFTTYYFELRYIYYVLEKSYDESNEKVYINKEGLTNLAYLIFFFGIGHATKSVFEHVTPNYYEAPFFKVAVERLQAEQDDYGKNTHGSFKVEHKGAKAIFLKVYSPFTGHGTKIGHYYRHLYQTVKYVSSQKHHLFTPQLKYSYVVMLRAQLSNFEQVLFYYNIISVLGRPWITEGYVKDYKMIVNLPLSFADFGIQPEEKFCKEIMENNTFFDWFTLKNRTIDLAEQSNNSSPAH